MGIRNLVLVNDLEIETLSGTAEVLDNTRYTKTDGPTGRAIDFSLPLVVNTKDGLREAEIVCQRTDHSQGTLTYSRYLKRCLAATGVGAVKAVMNLDRLFLRPLNITDNFSILFIYHELALLA